ncbi:hypothetical protein [Niveispirillum fermenti]|uniref:hypothetical protein n=1 Tax=Niveispirillum fermenti TaxID=1233113 RepID=UPI003A85F13B
MSTKLLNRFALVTFLAAAPLALAACDNKGPAERAGEKIDDAAERAGDQLEDAGDKIEDRLDRARD